MRGDKRKARGERREEDWRPQCCIQNACPTKEGLEKQSQALGARRRCRQLRGAESSAPLAGPRGHSTDWSSKRRAIIMGSSTSRAAPPVGCMRDRIVRPATRIIAAVNAKPPHAPTMAAVPPLADPRRAAWPTEKTRQKIGQAAGHHVRVKVLEWVLSCFASSGHVFNFGCDMCHDLDAVSS
ncbi:unnamed protein product [Prorocentrum cordatum]|uniref:Uncharacterized protein n=1 Tax=Prorocentrum cordatum TaxID=2364126 RepID=A0ABN9U8Q2_9DINO|nr:unnamed protein product [Polarella glacialis]